MGIPVRGDGCTSIRSFRPVPCFLVIVAAGLSLPARGLAQVTFTSGATVSYHLEGRGGQSGYPETNYYDRQTRSTNNPLAEPVQISKSIGGTLGSGGASSSVFANATAVGSAGLMRATISGSSSAAWTDPATSYGSLFPSSVTVSWTDAFILNNPLQPGQPLLVQSFLNVSGSMQYTLEEPAMEWGEHYGASSVQMSSFLSARDNLGRSLIAGNQQQFGAESNATKPGGSFTPTSIATPATIGIQLLVIEGQVGSMRIEMQLRAQGGSGAGSQFFGPDRTAMTFDADFGHTLSWGGITSVTDTNTGTPVTGWSIQSASGVDYANPIPEPAATALLAGSMLLALARRRRSRKPIRAAITVVA